MRGGFIRHGKLRTQGFQEICEDSLLTLKGLRPFRGSGNRPANVAGEMLDEGLGVAFRQFGKNTLHELLVFSRVHTAIIAPRCSFVQSMICMLYIRSMNLASLDLNLLVALDALVSEAHVGRAAKRIGLSQPAASHALRRLRELLDDPLLVRVGARMQLTPRAQGLRTPLAQPLDQVRALFVAHTFDPRTSSRRFALMMSDHVVDLVVSLLLERIVAHAPHIRLNVTPWLGSAVMTTDLARSIDLVIACTGEAFPGFHRQRLFTDTEAIPVPIGHPARARLQRFDDFLKAKHVPAVRP